MASTTSKERDWLPQTARREINLVAPASIHTPPHWSQTGWGSIVSTENMCKSDPLGINSLFGINILNNKHEC